MRNILFVGNSHTFFNDMPEVFRRLCAAAGEEVRVGMLAQPGVTFGWHKESPSLRFLLLHGGYDTVVLQQAAHSPAPPKEDTLSHGSWLIEKVQQAGAMPVVTMPWAERRFPEHQLTMYDTFYELAKTTGALISPVGNAFERTIAERGDIDLFWFDGEHCSPYGTYLNALCHFALLFGHTPEGLPALSMKHTVDSESGVEEILAQNEHLRQLTKGFQPAEMAKPETRSAYEKLGALLKQHVTTVWDKEALEFPLHGEKANYLQRTAFEAVNRLAK